jgi:hypothetical protein
LEKRLARSLEAPHNTWTRSYLTSDVRQDAHCMSSPWVSLRRDQLIPVNKAVNKKEQFKKGCRRRRKKHYVDMFVMIYANTNFRQFFGKSIFEIVETE